MSQDAGSSKPWLNRALELQGGGRPAEAAEAYRMHLEAHPDEAVAWACTYAGRRCVTAKAEARFREPARVGMPLVITGRVTKMSSLALRARAEIHVGSDDGPLLAELDAVMAVARKDAKTEEG